MLSFLILLLEVFANLLLEIVADKLINLAGSRFAQFRFPCLLLWWTFLRSVFVVLVQQ